MKSCEITISQKTSISENFKSRNLKVKIPSFSCIAIILNHDDGFRDKLTTCSIAQQAIKSRSTNSL